MVFEISSPLAFELKFQVPFSIHSQSWCLKFQVPFSLHSQSWCLKFQVPFSLHSQSWCLKFQVLWHLKFQVPFSLHSQLWCLKFQVLWFVYYYCRKLTTVSLTIDLNVICCEPKEEFTQEKLLELQVENFEEED